MVNKQVWTAFSINKRNMHTPGINNAATIEYGACCGIIQYRESIKWGCGYAFTLQQNRVTPGHLRMTLLPRKAQCMACMTECHVFHAWAASWYQLMHSG